MPASNPAITPLTSDLVCDTRNIDAGGACGVPELPLIATSVGTGPWLARNLRLQTLNIWR